MSKQRSGLRISALTKKSVRMEYLFRYLWKLSAVGLVLQCAFALGLTKQITIWNVVYVVWMLLVLPLFLGWLELIMEVA